ncbi:hypothetical protein [Flavobacterium tegetincola]|uniref:hypothetical protein n=1 Tax=Flavobacterium tegetincola TaxID=150172 RepID=UPI00040D0A78|nr:hypothetical protein [Flavobacterium tegetincola]
MITKEKLKKSISDFPEEFSIDDLVERLILIEKIEVGNQQSSNGEVISENKLEEEMTKWFE